VLTVVLAVLAAAVIAASFITVPYYALVPGDALAVSTLITVPANRAHHVHGQVLLTDVGVNNLRLIGYLFAHFDSTATIVPTGELTGNLPVSEFDAEGTVDMEESQLTAKAVALRQLGYAVPERDAGVTIYVIDPGSPAWTSLQVGDVVTAVDGTPTPNPDALVAAVHAYKPGDTITLRVGSITQPTPGRDVALRLAATVENHQTVPFIGIGDPQASDIPSMGTQPTYDFPFPVSINSDDIGGPSAGLAWTLGIISKLSGGDITHGKTVAATGTIHPDGTVGDVGGVKQKTVAVERAGATVFLVPDVEVATARAEASGGLKVMGVASLQQAMTDLEHLGGTLGTATKGPPPGPAGHSVPYGWQDSPWT